MQNKTSKLSRFQNTLKFLMNQSSCLKNFEQNEMFNYENFHRSFSGHFSLVQPVLSEPPEGGVRWLLGKDFIWDNF